MPTDHRTPEQTAYTRWMTHPGITVKGEHADAGQMRVIYRALHAARHELRAGDRVLIAVVMCMTQESTCRSLDGGDLDSVGPFQQRDSWGTHAQRKDAASSCRMFLTGGHTGEPGWNHYFPMSDLPDEFDLGAAVQRVQVSAFPTLYAQWQPEATRTVHSWLSVITR